MEYDEISFLSNEQLRVKIEVSYIDRTFGPRNDQKQTSLAISDPSRRGDRVMMAFRFKSFAIGRADSEAAGELTGGRVIMSVPEAQDLRARLDEFLNDAERKTTHSILGEEVEEH